MVVDPDTPPVPRLTALVVAVRVAPVPTFTVDAPVLVPNDTRAAEAVKVPVRVLVAPSWA